MSMIEGAAKGVNLLVTGTQIIIDTEIVIPGEPLFFPLIAYAVLKTKAGGAVTTTARIRIGQNGTHDDVMPLYVVPAGAAVGGYAMPPVVAPPYSPPKLKAGPIYFEIERAAVGPSELTGDIVVVGMLVSG